MIDFLEFDLAAVERILDSPLRPLPNCLNGPILEVTVSAEFEATLIANKERLARYVIGKGDGRFASGALAADLDGSHEAGTSATVNVSPKA